MAPRGRPALFLVENQSRLTTFTIVMACVSTKFFFDFGLEPHRISTARLSICPRSRRVIDVAFSMASSRFSRGWVLSLREGCSLVAPLTKIMAHLTVGLRGTFFHAFSLNR